MNGSAIHQRCIPRSLTIFLMLVWLGLVACQPMAEDAGAEDSVADKQPMALEDLDTDEASVVQIGLGEWRSDLPPDISLVVVGGGLINNSFPARSADGSEIAILYYAGDPMLMGYPTFDIYSTATLQLRERIELFSQHEQDEVIQVTRQEPDLKDQQLLVRIEALLDEVNDRLARGGFRPMETLFKLERYRMDGVEKFGFRIDYPSHENRRALTITSLASGRVELEMEMPRGVEVDERQPEGDCGWGGNPRQAWYDPELRVMALQMTFSTSIHGCEQPEQWFLKRLGQ